LGVIQELYPNDKHKDKEQDADRDQTHQELRQR
jgi:hypothetical protein